MGDDFRGYAPDHYAGLEDKIHEASAYDRMRAYQEYDVSRLGGTAAVRPNDQYLATVVRPIAVHVFNEKIVIVGSNGVVTELERA